MSYTNTSEPHGVIKRYFGELTSSDFIDSARDISVSEDFTQLRWIIADLLDVLSVSVSDQAFEEVIVQQLGSYTTNRRIHFALVGSRSFIIDFFHLNQFNTIAIDGVSAVLLNKFDFSFIASQFNLWIDNFYTNF